MPGTRVTKVNEHRSCPLGNDRNTDTLSPQMLRQFGYPDFEAERKHPRGDAKQDYLGG